METLQKPRHEIRPKPAGKRGRVVVVDDEPDFLAVVRDWLEPHFDVVLFLEGTGLLDTLEGLYPDLIILDVRLPGPDGFAVCRRILRDRRYQSLPILFLTASPSDSDFLRNIEAGGSSYMTKPVSRVELLARIDELLQARDSDREHWGP